MTELVKEIVVELEPKASAVDQEIVIGDDPKDKAAKDGKESKETPKESQAAIGDLKAQYEALKLQQERDSAALARANDAARSRDAENTQLKQDNLAARHQQIESELHIVSNAIAAAKSEADGAALEHKTALEMGDWAKVTEAQRKMSRAESRLVVLEDGKSGIEARIEQAKVVGRVPPLVTEPRGADPIESEINKYSPRTQSWLREHTECVSDPLLQKRAFAAHLNAEAEGYIPDSDAYFNYLDQRLGFAKADEGNGGAKETPRARLTNAAPVSRDANVAAGRLNGEKVRLSAREVEVAGDLGLTAAEYARRKYLMTKDGWYNREGS